MSRILTACLVGVIVMTNATLQGAAQESLRVGDPLPELKGYWYGLFLVHTVMFRRLLRAIACRAVAGDADLHRAAAGVPL
jgi:hypothetical protein